MAGILTEIQGVVWGVPLILLLLLTGLNFTVLLRGVQFRRLGTALWLALVERREPDGEGDISHFQALMTAMSATVGTANIVGVATAIGAGGPGALFWMWIAGLLGMATKYAEAVLGVRFRETDARGEKTGGPMYYLEHGLVGRRLGRVLAVAFAVFAAIAAFGIGNGVQSRPWRTHSTARSASPTGSPGSSSPRRWRPSSSAASVRSDGWPVCSCRR
jgi:AGCS family alanine or glycine:cation symporter